MSRITIYQLAELSGTSSSTVSAVMNGSWHKRRIGKETAAKIHQLAIKHGYVPNQQARALRHAKSGLAGLIIPTHDNRFFTSLSKHFEIGARNRGLVPIMAGTFRDPEEEQRVVQTFIEYSVEFLMIAGVQNTAPIAELCVGASLPHVFLDLPDKNSPSVVSNNNGGATDLVTSLLDNKPEIFGPAPRQRAYFLGGDTIHSATSERVAAFKAAIMSTNAPCDEHQILTGGYSAEVSFDIMSELYNRIGGLPSLLFINSQTALEGVLAFCADLPAQAFKQSVFGCWDFHPLGAHLKFPLYMVRQNSEELVRTGFELIDRGERAPQTIKVDTQLICPGDLLSGRLSSFG